jgi:hypothetical protein
MLGTGPDIGTVAGALPCEGLAFARRLVAATPGGAVMTSRFAADRRRARERLNARSGRSLALIVALACATVALGCSSEDSGLDDDDSTTTTETSPASGSTDSADDASSTSTSNSGGSTTSTADPAASWRLTAAEYRGQNGTTVTIDCTPDGELGSLWGDNPYTDDSSICTAGVHAGVITVTDGGEVEIEITPGEESYGDSQSNGVTSRPYGSWGGSFVVVTES